jgi:hypothetical protein
MKLLKSVKMDTNKLQPFYIVAHFALSYWFAPHFDTELARSNDFGN